jgi:hypothetical protein
LPQDEPILTQQFSIKIEKYESVGDKTVKEAGSSQGKALIGAVASYFGVPEALVGIALAAAIDPKQEGAAYSINYPSPPGYTVCFARPSLLPITASNLVKIRRSMP